jgi:hypothetical protein
MPVENFSPSIRFWRRSAHRAPIKTPTFPSIPGAAAFYDDSQQSFLDKYSDALYYIPMLLGVLLRF